MASWDHRTFRAKPRGLKPSEVGFVIWLKPYPDTNLKLPDTNLEVMALSGYDLSNYFS